MSHSASHTHGSGHGHDHGVPAAWLAETNVTLPRGWGMPMSIVLALVGLVCIGLTLAYPTLSGDHAPAAEGVAAATDHGHGAWKHALHAYHAGAIVPLGMMVGSLGLVLIFTLVKAGWCASIKRPIEQAASLIPLGLLLIAPSLIVEFAMGGHAGELFHWRTPGLIEHDHLLAHKSGFMNDGFFLVRLALYFSVWTYLAWRLSGASKQQDTSPSVERAAKAGFTAAWGILVYALCVAFASFDLIMGLDHHWFSTMFGVYFFAGSIFVSIALWTLTLVVLHAGGRMQGWFTEEHRHDLGKLQIAFVIFWAYIFFSQYFLIWYANIPEETAWMMARGASSPENEWTNVFWALCIGHFIVPFLFLLWRNAKRSSLLLGGMCAWIILMHMVDVFWAIRPEVYKTVQTGVENGVPVMNKIGFAWVDVTGMIGPVCLFLAVYIRRLASARIVPVNDPYIAEAAGHKNYV